MQICKSGAPIKELSWLIDVRRGASTCFSLNIAQIEIKLALLIILIYGVIEIVLLQLTPSMAACGVRIMPSKAVWEARKNSTHLRRGRCSLWCRGAACGAYCVAIFATEYAFCICLYPWNMYDRERERHDLRWWKCTPRACECVEQGVLFVHSTLAALLSARTCMRLKWKILWGVSAWDLVRAGESWAPDCEQWVILSLEILKAKKEKYPTAFLKL